MRSSSLRRSITAKCLALCANFYERLLFPPNHYTGGAPDEGYGRRIRCGLIYTMGVPDQAAHEKTNYDTTARDAARFQRFLGDT